jgi:hypothetical protein
MPILDEAQRAHDPLGTISRVKSVVWALCVKLIALLAIRAPRVR